MKLRKISFIGSGIILASMFSSLIAIWQAYNAYDAANKAQMKRHEAMSTVNDFQMQMLQLNKLIKAYISTADPKYLLYYYDLLAIQDGIKPSPPQYNSSIYWDTVIAKKTTHNMPKTGPTFSIIETMKHQNFTQIEFLTLQKIFDITRREKAIEQIAFAATQGLYDPNKKQFIEDGHVDLRFASSLIYGQTYQKLQADLGTLINILIHQTDSRTKNLVSSAASKLSLWLGIAVFSIILTAAMTLFFLLTFKKIVLSPIESLINSSKNIAKGNYTDKINTENWFDELHQLGLTFNVMSHEIDQDIRNREIQHLELEDAKKIAEEATKTKSMFLANISHELRTPLHSIIGMSYLTLQSELLPKQREFINHVHFAAKSLMGIINDLLDFSKIEAGKITIESIPFNLYDLIHNIVTLHQWEADEKAIQLLYKERDIASISQTHFVKGDPLRIGQIINNLLSNAIKFTDEGYVKLSTYAYIQKEKNLFVRIVVEDTGIGMSTQQQANLFQEFVQADTSTTRKFGGTGLGLTISKYLAECMGGILSVQSIQDHGSTFELELELELCDTDSHTYTIQSLAQQQCTPHCNHIRVLLVEDNEMNQKLAVELLSMRKIDVTIAQNGAEALKILSNHEYNYFTAILMDLQMPIMDGFETTKEIRKNNLYTHIPVIAMSAYTNKGEEKYYKTFGIDDYLGKPVDPENLYAILSKYMVLPDKNIKDTSLTQIVSSIDIPMVNVGKGLHNANYDQHLYIRLLKDFSRFDMNICKEMGKFLYHNDFESGEKLAHTLKGGLLGTIGAEALYQKAIIIEKKFKTKTLTEKELYNFTVEFDALICNIQKYIQRIEKEL